MNFDDFDISWRQRDDARHVDELENALRNVVNLDEDQNIEYSISWRLARLYHFRAMQETDKESAHKLFVEAEVQAQRAVFINARDAAGHFWMGVCRMERARTQSKSAAFRALIRTQQHLHAALYFDETFHFAGALRVLGRIEHLATWPLGSKKRALNFYLRALKIAPDNSTTQIYLAELLLSMKLTEEAKQTLRQLVSQPRDNDWIWEQKRDQQQARALLQKL